MAKYMKQSRVERILAFFECSFTMPDTDKVVSIEIDAFNVYVFFEEYSIPFRTNGL